MTPRWEPPTVVHVKCPCCGAEFSIPLRAGGMTDAQVNAIMDELRELHPEVYEEPEEPKPPPHSTK